MCLELKLACTKRAIGHLVNWGCGCWGVSLGRLKFCCTMWQQDCWWKKNWFPAVKAKVPIIVKDAKMEKIKEKRKEASGGTFSSAPQAPLHICAAPVALQRITRNSPNIHSGGMQRRGIAELQLRCYTFEFLQLLQTDPHPSFYRAFQWPNIALICGNMNCFPPYSTPFFVGGWNMRIYHTSCAQEKSENFANIWVWRKISTEWSNIPNVSRSKNLLWILRFTGNSRFLLHSFKCQYFKWWNEIKIEQNSLWIWMPTKCQPFTTSWKFKYLTLSNFVTKVCECFSFFLLQSCGCPPTLIVQRKATSSIKYLLHLFMSVSLFVR